MDLKTELAQYVTPEEYLAMGEQTAAKNEYFAGKILPMARQSANHNRIVLNASIELRLALRGTACQLFKKPSRLLVEKHGLYAYPDVMVVCGDVKRAPSAIETVLNPSLIIEVMAPETACFDRGRKFELYRKLESLEEYVLIDQDRPYIEHFRRIDANHWLLRFMEDMGATLKLDAVHCDIPLCLVYEYVDWLNQ